MPRRAATSLAICVACAAAHAVTGPAALADRPLSDITCDHGRPATHDRGTHRFADETMVLGCARLVDGGVVQIDAGRQAAEPASACLWLTFGPPRSDGLFACGPGLGREPRVLLVLRHRSPSPFLVVGVTPADVKRVAVAYSTAQGTRRRTSAHVPDPEDRLRFRAGARLGDRMAGCPASPRATALDTGLTPRGSATGRSTDGRAGERPRSWCGPRSISFSAGW